MRSRLAARPRRAGTWVLPLAILAAGCASDWSKEPLSVSVSAANYSELSGEELYAKVNAPRTTTPQPPAVTVPSRPLFYAFVPGEVYDSDVPLETVYRELAVPLAHRGYFNVVYQAQSGHLPDRVDYLLRIHCGVRRWKTPVVRTDKVTWGNSGLESSERNPRSMDRVGEDAHWDPRSGQDASYAIQVATFLQVHSTAAVQANTQYTHEHLSDYGDTQDYCLVVVEAFRFGDVVRMKKAAPCAWATFVAVPLRTGQQFSGVLRTMARTATPYFGATSNGIEEYEVPPGKVLMGEPVTIPGPAHGP
jgi:hypothetical protein